MHSPCEVPLGEYLPWYECQLICMAAGTEVSPKIFAVTKSAGIFRCHLHATAWTPVILLHHQNPAAAKHRISDPFWLKTDVMCVLTQHTFPPYQGVLQFSKSTAFMRSYPNLHCQAVQEYPFLDCLIMKTNAPWSFNMPETTHLTTQSHNPEYLNLQQQQCKNLKPHITFKSPNLTGFIDYLFQIKAASYPTMATPHHSVIIITASEPTIPTNVKYCMSFSEH